jgi:hypothetical protein
MVGISNSMNSVLLLLRQNGPAAAGGEVAADEIVKIANGGTGEAQAEVALSFSKEDPSPVNDALNHRAGIDLGDLAPTFTDNSIPPDVLAKLNKMVQRVDDPDEYRYAALRQKVIDNRPHVAQQSYSSKVIEATTLAAEPGEKWKSLSEGAAHRAAILIGSVIEANSHLHILSKVTDTDLGNDHWSAAIINAQVDFANFNAEQMAPYTKQILDDAAEAAGLGAHLTRTESGEYRVGAFRITSSDGQLVAELRQDGHFLLYNEDGSVGRDMGRSDVCAELSYGLGCSHFGRTAALVYSDDKDLQFY